MYERLHLRIALISSREVHTLLHRAPSRDAFLKGLHQCKVGTDCSDSGLRFLVHF